MYIEIHPVKYLSVSDSTSVSYDLTPPRPGKTSIFQVLISWLHRTDYNKSIGTESTLGLRSTESGDEKSEVV